VKVIVVGAGFAGLAAADELYRAGADVEVLEARDRVGGRVWSVPFAGATAELGAEFILPHDTELIELARRLELRLVRKGTLYGNREPRGGESVTRDEIAAAMEQLSALPEVQGETVYGALSRAGCASGVADAIAARLEVSCAYGADDLDASVLRDGAGAFGDFPSHTVQGGNDRIARRLAAALGDNVHLSSPVRSIRWTQREMQVSTDDAEANADAVVVAVPASVVEEIKFDPPLGEQKVNAHRAVRYGQAAKLFVPLRAPAPPSQILSVTGRWWCYTQLGAEGEPLPFVAAFAGSPRAIEALDLGDGPGRWVDDLARLRPDLELDAGAAIVSTWEQDPWVRGAYSARSASSSIENPELSRPVGRLAFAGEHTAGRWHGLMEGALRSGRRAAAELLQRVAG
jgi:monoamine oxidase